MSRAILMLLAVMAALLVVASGIAVASTINGDNRANTLRGTDKKDTIKGRGGNDKIYGKKGNDRLVGGRGKDAVYGSYGNDILLGGPNPDIIKGGSDYDVLIGGPGPDKLYGQDDGDEINGGKGNDEMYAGAGHPLYWNDLSDNEGDDTYHAGPDQDAMTDYSTTSDGTYIVGRDFGRVDVTDAGGSDVLDLTLYSRSEVTSRETSGSTHTIVLNDGSRVTIRYYTSFGYVIVRFG